MAWTGGNFYLTQAQMEENATYIWNYLFAQGWTLNAVAGMLGNMQTESTINPGIWQGLDPSHAQPWGFGLVQWTPSTKYTDWCSSNSLIPDQMDSNLQRIIWEVTNNEQWIPKSPYNYSFYEFTQSTDTAYNLGMAFLKCYERPADPDQPQRGSQAQAWYDFLGGSPPEPPVTKKKMPLYFYLRKEIFY